MKLRILSSRDIERSLPMAECIELMKKAFAQWSTGKATVPLRTQLPVSSQDGVVLFMPGFLTETGDLGVKVVSVFPHNLKQGIPTIHAVVVVLDGSTGVPVAFMDGTFLTALRTGAASGAATDLLARKEARVLVLFGAGSQGRTQLEAVCTVRPIERVWVVDADAHRASVFVEAMRARGTPVPTDIRVAPSAEEAVRQADIICTATTSSRPVFDGRALRSGTHINAVGAYTPQMQEVDSETVRRAKVVIDSRQASLAEAGDLLIPLSQGVITEKHIHAEIGEIVAGLKPGRVSDEEITYFKSVGVAVQDIAAARRVLERAIEQGLGTEVEL
jgi:alanine dehydrogenase